MTKNLFNSMMNFFKSSKDVILTDERIVCYWETLKDYPDKYVRKVTYDCAKKYDFFPSIAQIVKEFDYLESEELYEKRAVKKIEPPRKRGRDLEWIRQTRVLLSCYKNQNQNHSKLLNKEELQAVVELNGGDKRLLNINTTAGEITGGEE